MESFQIPFFDKHSLKVHYTDKGVTEISFQNKKVSRQDLKTPFQKKFARELSRYLSGKNQFIQVPVDWSELAGTDFQKRVWKRLAKIPYGRVKTYGEIAKEVASPKAARAVGSACGKNPVLLAIPCHRVVGGNGLGGFSGGGLPLKRKLHTLENIEF